MTYRKRNILLAAGLAIVAVIFMVVYISKAHSGNSTQAPAGSVSVLVATRDISAGTPASELHGAFARRKVATAAALPDVVSSLGTVEGQTVTQDILAGQQVTQRQFGPASASGVRIELRGRERVVQLEGDASQVLDGTLRRGDHVDVLGTWNAPEGCGECHVSRTIVKNALVLATSAELGKGSSNTQTVPVQLRLTDGEAGRVFWMVKNGQWWIELRPVIHPRAGTRGYDNATTILGKSAK